MSLTSDYFLLYHGKVLTQVTSYETIDFKEQDDFFKIAALVLCANRKDYQNFISLNSFKSLIAQITRKEVKNVQDLNQLQFCLLQSIQDNTKKSDITILHNSFEYLKNEQILQEGNYNKLISLFDPNELEFCDEIDVKDEPSLELKKPFKEAKFALEELILDLSELFLSNDYINELEDTNKYLNTQKFSIGITGVMNAGKSTMLNALMGQEILGSAVVPETANLTIVKYDEHPSAQVFYWNKKEWENIEKSAKEIPSIQEFVKETKNIFKDDLDTYIKEDSFFEDVDINNLSAYTSAEASLKKCNLVKYVQLKSDLKFLENGIEIVDTPGLDDPVIQREEITKEYIAKCDLMLHLMNVSQSATLKDVEFIIDALLYQNITKILIVITRADTVSKKELDEVIAYTKSSIKTQLKALNKDSSLDYILKSIEFIAISGKMALYHRTGRSQEAIDLGYALEDTGILDIEDYLHETLFGSNSSKSDLIIKSAKTKLLKTIEKEKNSFNYELILLAKSKDELEKELEEFNKKKKVNQKIFLAMKDDINIYAEDMKNYINSLDAFLINELEDLQTIIKQRVFSDVKYSFEKTKKRPQSSRIKVIVQTAIKDGIIDVIRDYRYKFIKKSQSIGELSEQKYKDFGFLIDRKNENFDAMGFFKDDFKSGFLSSSNEVLITKIIKEVEKSKSNKLNELDRNLQEYLKEEFLSIEETIKVKAQKISQILIKDFFVQITLPLDNFEEKVKKDQISLEKRLSDVENSDIKKDELTMIVHKKLKKLEIITKGLKI